jgi:hypothetical protein
MNLKDGLQKSERGAYPHFFDGGLVCVSRAGVCLQPSFDAAACALVAALRLAYGVNLGSGIDTLSIVSTSPIGDALDVLGCDTDIDLMPLVLASMPSIIKPPPSYTTREGRV